MTGTRPKGQRSQSSQGTAEGSRLAPIAAAADDDALPPTSDYSRRGAGSVCVCVCVCVYSSIFVRTDTVENPLSSVAKKQQQKKKKNNKDTKRKRKVSIRPAVLHSWDFYKKKEKEKRRELVSDVSAERRRPSCFSLFNLDTVAVGFLVVVALTFDLIAESMGDGREVVWVVVVGGGATFKC
ncbi:hypothetical protein INR49_001886 [Caranx melampygus]|nr:hypothetical protein INR49_001886 [Caranx melampygus]